jgi:saccharopine dehydrogenase-like NADP-dependent oxidoreductase
MKQILLFGAGKSAGYLIDYLLQHAVQDNYHLTVADADAEAVNKKIGDAPHATAVSLDITDAATRISLIEKADLVLSLLPPALHIVIAKDCIRYKKNLLTASYVDASLKELKQEIEKNNLLFLCEMGLDPGIDHMSAKRLVDGIHAAGGHITSFRSHCGGLIAPESDDNPWHYKISWNPKNVVMAGKAGACFKLDGQVVELDYSSLFHENRYVQIPGYETLCWYPNRDSLSYISTYGVEECQTFIRTTLRHPDFIYGWRNIIDLHLTDETSFYESDNRSLASLFKEHMDRNGFSEWLEQKLHEQFDVAKDLLSNLVNLVELEQQAAEKGIEPMDEFMMVDDKGDLQQVDIDDLKINAASTLADKMHTASLTLKQLFYLGLDDHTTHVNLGKCSAATLLQFALEKKLALQPGDKDLVIMFHEIEFEKEGETYRMLSTLRQKGEDSVHTAMAKTVGLPLGIAARMVLHGTISLKGLKIPTDPAIYEPVLQELKLYGVSFDEQMEKAGK